MECSIGISHKEQEKQEVKIGDRPRQTLDFIGYRGVCPQKRRSSAVAPKKIAPCQGGESFGILTGSWQLSGWQRKGCDVGGCV